MASTIGWQPYAASFRLLSGSNIIHSFPGTQAVDQTELISEKYFLGVGIE